MNTKPQLKLTLLLALALAIATTATAQQRTPLFDGKTLDGWTQRGGKAIYTIENGAIVGTTVANTDNSFLCTTSTYGDFILELEFKVDARLNSGVQIRSECFDKPKPLPTGSKDAKGKTKTTKTIPANRVHGYQVEIDPDKGDRLWVGGIYDEARRGWLYPTEKAQQDKLTEQGRRLYKPGDWNHLRVEARGDTIKTYLNGELRTTLTDTMTPRGFIALQVHGIGKDETKVGIQARFRNLYITPLDNPADSGNANSGSANSGSAKFPLGGRREAPPNTLTPAEKSAGWRLLWDGATTTGWRGVKTDTFPAQGWTIKDGALTIHKTDAQAHAPTGKSKSPVGSGRDIITTDSFSDFELLIDFKLTPRANSGIKYFIQPNSNVALEYQILDDALHPDAKAGRNGNRKQASLYDLFPPAPGKKDAPIGEWNTARIISRGTHVEHWLNGQKVLEYDRASPEFREAIAQSKFKTNPGYGEWPEGHILLQDHGDEVSFRNIKILVPKK